jgi:hypothetical protein
MLSTAAGNRSRKIHDREAAGESMPPNQGFCFFDSEEAI